MSLRIVARYIGALQRGQRLTRQDDKKAYGYVDGGKGEGDYSLQSRAWDASMNAMDGPNCLNFTLWTYVPDNNHEFGDNWYVPSVSVCVWHAEGGCRYFVQRDCLTCRVPTRGGQT